MSTEINLGDKVKDIVTGFEGIVTARAEFLNGCVRLQITPEMKKDGTLPDEIWFDQARIKVKKEKAVPSFRDTAEQQALGPAGPRRDAPSTRGKQFGRRSGEKVPNSP